MSVAVIAVATAAICVPFNPDLTADELQRYFSDLQIAALFDTRGHELSKPTRRTHHSAYLLSMVALAW